MIDVMVSQADIVVVTPNSPCPCRSGKVTAECCMAADGTFRVKFPRPLPPAEITGFSHAKCYMLNTRNCSENISGEHYMSKSVLDLFCAKTVRVGFPWNDVGAGTTVSVENLTSGILCERHNHALTPLDAVAIQAFSNLFDAMIYVTRKSLATKRAFYAASGEGLELWALKLLFCTYHATMVTEDRNVLKDTQPPDFGLFQRALEGGALAGPCGLYVRMGGGGDGHPCRSGAADSGKGKSGHGLALSRWPSRM
jgi:hypothetical protein